jgi:hypothetical protein
MTRLIIIAGVTAILCAGAVSGAQAQAPLQPPGVGQPGHPGGAEMRGPRMNGPGARGPDQRGGRRGGLGGPLTPAERQARVAALFTRMDANKDGRATFAEFQSYQESRRAERQRQAFNGLSGGQDSITLDQLTTKLNERGQRGRRDQQRRGGGGRG